MTKVEENKELLKRVINQTEEMVGRSRIKITSFNLSVIATMLADNSKSLATIANKIESGDEE